MLNQTGINGDAATQRKQDVAVPADHHAASTAIKSDERKLTEKLERSTKILLQIEEMHQRLVKAREFVEKGAVHRIKLVKNHYTVAGDKSGDFLVNNGRCNCDSA